MIKITRKGIVCSRAKMMKVVAKARDAKNLAMERIINRLVKAAMDWLCDFTRIEKVSRLSR